MTTINLIDFLQAATEDDMAELVGQEMAKAIDWAKARPDFEKPLKITYVGTPANNATELWINDIPLLVVSAEFDRTIPWPPDDDKPIKRSLARLYASGLYEPLPGQLREIKVSGDFSIDFQKGADEYRVVDLDPGDNGEVVPDEASYSNFLDEELAEKLITEETMQNDEEELARVAKAMEEGYAGIMPGGIVVDIRDYPEARPAPGPDGRNARGDNG